jgi:hypothetical protein
MDSRNIKRKNRICIGDRNINKNRPNNIKKQQQFKVDKHYKGC